jgi:hypothetical protein
MEHMFLLDMGTDWQMMFREGRSNCLDTDCSCHQHHSAVLQRLFRQGTSNLWDKEDNERGREVPGGLRRFQPGMGTKWPLKFQEGSSILASMGKL